MAFSDLEDSYPEEPNSHHSDTNHGAAEKEQHQGRENGVVNWKNFGRLNKRPVYRIKNVDMSKDVPTSVLAEGVFGFIDGGQKHRYPRYRRN